MTRDAVITYQGLACTSVNFSRALGLRPDVGEVVLNANNWRSWNLNPERPERKIQQPAYYRTYLQELERDPFEAEIVDVLPFTFEQSGDLVLEVRDTGQKIVFNHIYISRNGIRRRKQSEEEKKKGIIPTQFEIEICDERRLWEDRGVLQGDFNVIDPNGIKIGDNSYRPNTVNGDQLWTLPDLIDKAVAALPSPRKVPYFVFKYNVASFSALVSITPIGFINGGGRLASAALGELLDRYGLYLSLLITPGQYGLGAQGQYDPDRGDIIVIVERHQTEGLLWEESFKAEGLIERQDLKLQPVFRPFGAVVTSKKKIIRETTVTDFTAVFQDPKTKMWLELEASADFIGIDITEIRRQVLQGLTEKEKGFAEVKDKDLRKQLQQQAYKCWIMNLDDETILPMQTERIIAADENGKPTVVAPNIVELEYFFPLENKDPSSSLWDNAYGVLPGDKEPSYDVNAGVIKFPQPVGTLSANKSAAGAPKGAQIPRLPEDENTKRKMELLRNWLEKYGAADISQLGEIEKILGLDKMGGILDPLISALTTGSDPRIPLEGVTSKGTDLINAVYNYLRSAPGSQNEEAHLENIQLALGQIFKANSTAPSSMKQYADSWQKVAGQKTEEEKEKEAGAARSLYSLDEADFAPGKISVTFQYVSDDYWSFILKSGTWPKHLALIDDINWQPVDTEGFSNIEALNEKAKKRALEKFKGPDELRSYEVHVAGFWPMVADGDRPRVTWEVDADGDFRPRTLYLWDDFIGRLQGRPGIGEKEGIRRTLDTRARIP